MTKPVGRLILEASRKETESRVNVLEKVWFFSIISL